MGNKLVQIGVAAGELKVSVDTIRRWAKQGLIKASRDGRGNRLFNVAEIERLQRKLSGTGEEKPFTVLRSEKTYSRATCVDLFAGGGGTALGFHNAGIPHVFLNEFDRSAVATLRKNSQAHGFDWNICPDDVHEVDFSQLDAQVIQAGFPCQAFS